MSEKTRRKIRKTAALLLALVCLALAALGSTYAQNSAGTDDDVIFYKAELVEIPDISSSALWYPGDANVEKRVYARNPGKDDEHDDREFGDIYIRIQLKEFMELYDAAKPVYSEIRYMIGADGNFLAFDTQADAQDYLTGNNLGTHIVEQLQPYRESVPKWYIQTKETSPDGVYGNYLILDYENTQATNLIQIDPPEKADMTDQRDNELYWSGIQDDSGYNDTAACNYTVRQWQQGLYKWEVNGAGQPAFTDYISWVYGDDIILFSKWDGSPCDKWIIDDSGSNSEGWVYWGNLIEPGEQTGDFITALRQVNVLEGAAYYAVHTDMQAVSYNELDNWN